MNAHIKYINPLLLAILFVFGCDTEQVDPINVNDLLVHEQSSAVKNNKPEKVKKITGDVQFIWTKNKGGENGKKPEDLLAFASITAHETRLENLDRNNFTYTILNNDLTLHREIQVAINGVFINSEESRGFVTGVVVSDTKGCVSGPDGGHEAGCQGGGGSGGTDTHDGGCSHDTGDTDNPDGGCSDDHTDTDGGCTNDHTDTDGGCSDDHTDTDGGCTDDHTDDGGCAGGGDTGHSGGGGNTVSGKNCRVGQVVVLKVHDVGNPGADGDGITWKWFDPAGSFVPGISDTDAWPHLCKKNIVEGNIVIHD